jgi:hypothetical protein
VNAKIGVAPENVESGVRSNMGGWLSGKQGKCEGGTKAGDSAPPGGLSKGKIGFDEEVPSVASGGRSDA